MQLKATHVTESYTCSQHFALFEEGAWNLIVTEQNFSEQSLCYIKQKHKGLGHLAS